MTIPHAWQLGDGTVITVLNTIFGNDLIRAVVALLVVWLLSGICVSLKNHTFSLGKIGEWLGPTANYVVGAILLQLMAMFVPEQFDVVGDVVAYTAWATLIMTLVGKILGNIRTLGVDVETGEPHGLAEVIPLWATDLPREPKFKPLPPDDVGRSV